MRQQLIIGGALLLLVVVGSFDEQQKARARAVAATAVGTEDPCPEGTRFFENDTRRWCEAPSGVLHGPVTEWHEQGGIATSGTYASGDRTGQWTTWFPNGQRASEGPWDDGRQVGNWVWWYPNGLVAVVGGWKDGRPHGDWSYWHSQKPQQLVRAQFCEGEPCEEWVRWGHDGALIERIDHGSND